MFMKYKIYQDSMVSDAFEDNRLALTTVKLVDLFRYIEKYIAEL